MLFTLSNIHFYIITYKHIKHINKKSRSWPSAKKVATRGLDFLGSTIESISSTLRAGAWGDEFREVARPDSPVRSLAMIGSPPGT